MNELTIKLFSAVGFIVKFGEREVRIALYRKMLAIEFDSKKVDVVVGEDIISLAPNSDEV